VTSFALALGFPWLYDGTDFLGPGALAAMIGMWAGGEVLFDSWLPVNLPSESGMRVRPVSLHRVMIGLTANGALEVRVGGGRGRAMAGDDAVRALANLSGSAVGAGGIAETSHEALDEGWLLSRLHPTAQRLMQAWVAADPNGRDRVELLDLPSAWQVAFYIVCTEAAAPGKDVEELRARLAAASSLAVVAERLDDELTTEQGEDRDPSLRSG
jgi:hypothetical protein